MEDSFKDFVLEQLQGLEGVDARSMFGGYGLYLREDFFAIVFDDRLYFRTDDRTLPKYADQGSGPFRPNERQTLKSYYEVPPEVVEDREQLTDWAFEASATTRGAGQQ